MDSIYCVLTIKNTEVITNTECLLYHINEGTHFLNVLIEQKHQGINVRGTEDIHLATDYEVHILRYLRYTAVDKMYNLTANKTTHTQNNNSLII